MTLTILRISIFCILASVAIGVTSQYGSDNNGGFKLKLELSAASKILF